MTAALPIVVSVRPGDQALLTGYPRRCPDAAPAQRPLFRDLLGDAFALLPRPVRDLHDAVGTVVAVGRCSVVRGQGLLAYAVGALFAFPPEGEAMPVTVTIERTPTGERWRRNFAGWTIATRLALGRGSAAGMLIERFGPVAFGLEVPGGPEGVFLAARRWWLCGVPMPRALCPLVAACEVARDGRFFFDVDIRLPWLGRLIHYRGALVRVHAETAPAAHAATGRLGDLLRHLRRQASAAAKAARSTAA